MFFLRSPFLTSFFRSRYLLCLIAVFFLVGCSSERASFDPFGSNRKESSSSTENLDILQTHTRVGLLLPLSASGETGRVARAMKQAAEQALIDSKNSDFSLLTEDTFGTTQGAKRAAEKVISQGARLILGPLLASEVESVASVARPRSVSVVTFSSVASLAGPGVYVMGFLPEEDVSESVGQGVASGFKTYVALLPQTLYGKLVEKALRQAVEAQGARLLAVHSYNSALGQSLEDQIRLLQTDLQPISPDQKVVLFLAEGGQNLTHLIETLERGGILSHSSLVLMGTGLWSDPKTQSLVFQNVSGIYAGVDPQAIATFKERYENVYGETPLRLASLAYDAVRMAMALSSDFTAQSLQKRDGFNGVNGAFRFSEKGLVMRHLILLKVVQGQEQKLF